MKKWAPQGWWGQGGVSGPELVGGGCPGHRTGPGVLRESKWSQENQHRVQGRWGMV